MNKKILKYGKSAIFVVIVVLILYLLLTSSVFNTDKEVPSNESDLNNNLNFTINLYDQDRVLVQLEDAAQLENGTVKLQYDDLDSSRHSISLSGKSSFEIIDIRSSTSASKIEILRGQKVLYEEFLEYEKPTDNTTKLEIGNIEDKDILLSENLELNASKYVNDSNIEGIEFEWFMGDSTNYETKVISHNYRSSGNYEARLVVNTDRTSRIENFNVTVSTQDAIDEIVAPKTVKVGESITFNGDASTTSFATRSEWLIDRERYTENNPTLTFEESGVYEVILTAESKDGEVEIESYRLVVQSD